MKKQEGDGKMKKQEGIVKACIALIVILVVLSGTAVSANFSENQNIGSTLWDGPEITNVVLTASDPLDTKHDFGWENVSCIVTDDVAVDTVKLVLDTTEYPMQYSGADTYYFNTTLMFGGIYDYYIWANDTNENIIESTPYIFHLPPNWDVDIIDDVIPIRADFWDLVETVKYYGDTGSNGWIRADVDNNGEIDFWDITWIVRYF